MGGVPVGAEEEETVPSGEDSEQADAVILERMRVISAPIDRTPGSVSYLGEEELQRQHYTDIHRVLSLVPGVNLQEEEGYGTRPNIGLRGSGAERSQKITLLEDGILIAPAPYAAPAAYYFPTTGRMSGIEVRKGSSAIRQGPYTSGGVLNLMSSSIPGRFSGDLELAAGSDGQFRAHGRVGDSTQRFGWLIETFQQEADGFKSLDDAGPTGFELSDYMVKLRVGSGPQASRYQSLELKVGRTVQVAYETYVGLSEADFVMTPYRRYSGSQEDRLDSDHDQVQLIYLAKPSSKVDIVAAVYRNTFFRNWYKLQSVDGVGLGSILDDPGTYATEFAHLRGDTDSPDDALLVRANRRTYRSQGIQTILGVQAGANHSVEIGVRYHEDFEDRFQEEDGFRVERGAMVRTSVGAPGSQSNRISEARAAAFFVRDTIRSGKWTLSPGLRLETIDYTRRDFGGMDPQRTGVALSTRARDVSQWIPGFGAAYRIDRRSSFFAGVHRGFAPPGPGADVDTNSESSVNFEIGYRREAGLTRFEAAAYFNDYRNLLGADTLSSGGSGSGDLFNGGAARVYGVEGVVHHDFLVADGRLRAPISLTYTWTEAEFRSSFDSDFNGWGDQIVRGDELPYIAPHAATLQGGLAGARWSGFAMLIWADGMRTQPGQGPIDPLQSTDPHLLVDLTVKREFGKGVRGFVQVRNLTDEVYAVARRPAGVRPGLPRSLLAGVHWSF